MLSNHATYKYEAPYKGPFAITWRWTNDTITIQYGPMKIRHNIGRIKPYKSDTNIEYINPEKCAMMSTYDHQLYTSVLH